MPGSKTRKPDFEGWASKNDLLCDDGVIIRGGAFGVKDGDKVPLVWNHQHDTVTSTLGHAVMENRKEGIYAYVYLNDTPDGQHAKAAVKNGDITSLSICATNIESDGNIVTHGIIREISLVLAGANPGAKITSTLEHGIPFDESDDEAIVYTGESIIISNENSDLLMHSSDGNSPITEDDENKKTALEVVESMTEEQKKAVAALIGSALISGIEAEEETELDQSINFVEKILQQASSKEAEEDEKSIIEVVESMTEEQKNAVALLVVDALETEVNKPEEELQHSAKGTTWEKKNHKYLKKADGKYFYNSEHATGYTPGKDYAGAYYDTTAEGRANLRNLIREKGLSDSSIKEVTSLYVDPDDNTVVNLRCVTTDGKREIVSVPRSEIKDVEGVQFGEKDDTTNKERKGRKMAHNAFEAAGHYVGSPVITQEMKTTIMQRAQSLNSFRQAMEEAVKEGGVLYQAAIPKEGMETPSGTASYGINDMSMLLPDGYTPVTDRPEVISRDQGWVTKWMSKVRNVPFKRVKSWFVDITGDEARAKGYVKGTMKVEEVVDLLKRTTDPQTVYKKQKLDRDDILDLDFDMVPWLKSEMELMLNEEEARACLVGDGRSSSASDKIREDHVRPVIKDVALFNVVVKVTVPADADENTISDAIIDSIILNRGQYKGTGVPTFWTTQDRMSKMLILKDKIGRRIYESATTLATTLMVDEIVPVDVMEDQTVTIDSKTYPVIGTIVNPVDYTIGGRTNREKLITEGFDIDYNQQKYLIEDRMSGALTKPFSALTFVLDKSGASTTSANRSVPSNS